MHTQKELPHQSRHYLSELDNHILVENHAGGVVIHASRDNLSDSTKARLVRRFAAEGHIPDRCGWFSDLPSREFFGVRWVVDDSWSESDPRIEQRTRRREIGVTLLLVVVVVLLRWSQSPQVF